MEKLRKAEKHVLTIKNKRDRLNSIRRPLFIPGGDGEGFRLSDSQDLHFTFDIASLVLR